MIGIAVFHFTDKLLSLTIPRPHVEKLSFSFSYNPTLKHSLCPLQRLQRSSWFSYRHHKEKTLGKSKRSRRNVIASLPNLIRSYTPQSLLRNPFVVGVKGVGDPCRPTGSIPRGVGSFVYSFSHIIVLYIAQRRAKVRRHLLRSYNICRMIPDKFFSFPAIRGMVLGVSEYKVVQATLFLSDRNLSF
jgi:hypothetical protein